MKKEAEFLQKAKEMGCELKELENAAIVHHFDADGIPAAAIIFSAMCRNGIAPSVIAWKKMTLENVEKLKNIKQKQLIFCDLGAGYLSILEENLKEKEIYVIDHHEPEKPAANRSEKIKMLNGHDFGLDGAEEICAGSTAYLCFQEYADLSQLAIVSIVGDMHDKNGITGVNKLILRDAITANVVKVKKDLRIFGRSARSLISFLSYCSEPYLPDLTGNDKNCARFLFDNEIPFKKDGKYLSYYELDEKDQKKFTSALIEHCLRKKFDEIEIEKMIGDVYLFSSEKIGTPFYDAYEYASLMNACGRNNASEIGVGACLKNETKRKQAMELLQLHRTNLRRAILLARNKTSNLGEYYLLDARGQIKESIIGTVASAIVLSLDVKKVKPVIAIANDDEDKEMTKISTRANSKLVENGVDLNKMIRNATESLGKSFGGGHKVAAGASVEKRHLPEFLKRCSEIIKEQNNGEK